MKKINLPLLWDYAKSYVIPVLLIILVINQCSNTQSVQVAVNKANFERLKENNVILSEKVKSVLYQSKITNKEVQAKDSLIALRELERDNLKQQLDAVIIAGKKKKSKLNNLDNNGFANYYNERFKVNNALVTSNGVELTKDLPTKVASDLIDGDVAKAQLGITRKMLENEFDKSNLLTGQVTLLKDDNQLLNIALKDVLNANIELISLAENQNKIISKLSTFSRRHIKN